MPYANHVSIGMNPPLGLPPPDDYSRIWLRCGDGRDERWGITILQYAKDGYNGSLPSLARLQTWK